MNERLRELAEQANFNEQDIENMSPGFEKFAELVAKDAEAEHFSAGYVCGRSDGIMETALACLAVCGTHSSGDNGTDFNRGWSEASAAIRQEIRSMFGVEAPDETL